MERRPRKSTPAWERPWGVLDPGGNTADSTAPAWDTVQEVEIHIGSSSKGRGSIIDDGGVYQASEERGFAVHCYVITVRPTWGVVKGSGDKNRNTLVGTGGNWPGGRASGGSGKCGRGKGRIVI